MTNKDPELLILWRQRIKLQNLIKHCYSPANNERVQELTEICKKIRKILKY
jgi:hypothetical protein